MNSLGAFPEDYVPLAKGPQGVHSPDKVVRQQSTAFLNRYQKLYERSLEQQQKLASKTMPKANGNSIPKSNLIPDQAKTQPKLNGNSVPKKNSIPDQSKAKPGPVI